jgi:hypothetical protein
MIGRRLIFLDFILWVLAATTSLTVWRLDVAANSTESNHQNSGRLFRENLQRLQTLGMCGTPRPRVFYVGKVSQNK